MPFSRTALSEHDRTWTWKAALRTIAILIDIVGIALTAWAVANLSSRNDWLPSSDFYDGYYYYDDFDFAEIPWNLISVHLSHPSSLPSLIFIDV